MCAALITLAALGMPAGARDEEPRKEGERSTDPALGGKEIASLRTRTSRTYAGEDGTLIAKVFAGSVNYRDSSGEWHPIDNDLRVAGGKVRNGANRYGVSLPDTLGDGSVRVTDGDAWVAFAPEGAKASAALSGNTATYSEAWPGVEARYRAAGDSVKEELVLRDRDATRNFSFALTASAGLEAEPTRRGAIELRDGGGGKAFELSAPVMVDAAGASHAVDASLTPQGEGWRMSLSPDSSWLDDPDRQWPVTIDPDVYPNANPDCLVANGPGETTTNYCAVDFLEAGWGHSPLHDHHALLKFDVPGAVPAGSDVLNAWLNLKLRSQSGTAAKEIGVHRVTSAWTSAVTWNKRDATNNWTTPGGDYVATPEWTEVVGGGTLGWYSWSVFDMVKGWAAGDPNNGLLLNDDGSHTVSATMKFDASETTATQPWLSIQYMPRIGERRGWTYEEFELSDRMTLKVNPGSGNLLLRQRDLTIPGGTGPDLNLSRTYNSGGDNFGAFGHDFTWDTGDDFQLTFKWDAVRMWGPTGLWSRFKKSGSAYTTPPGFDATLTPTSGTTFTFTEHQSQTKYKFESSGDGWYRLISQTDRNGRQITYAYSATHDVGTITDSQGRVTTVTHNAGGQITKIVDPAGREYLYGYTNLGGLTQLTSYTDPAGGVTQYAYTNNKLTKITTPGGSVTKIEYFPSTDPAKGRVKSITRATDPVAGTGPKTQFAYTEINRDGTGKTTVTDPRNYQTKYEFDGSGRPAKVVDALNRTASSTYTANSNVQEYTAPNNTGTTPSTKLDYSTDGNNNLTDTTTMTGPGTGPGSQLITHADYGPTRTGGPIAGAAFLPKFVRNTQDTASGTSTRGTAIEYDNPEGNPTLITKGTTSSVVLGYRTGADGKPGELASSKDGRGNQTTYRYDFRGNLTEIEPPLITGGGTQLGTTTIDYSGAAGDDLALSRPTKVTDGRGNKTLFEYDNLERVKKLTYQSSAGVEEARFEYTYDLDGNLTQRKDIVGGTTNTYGLTYDDLNRLTQETLPGPRTNTYTYDAASNLASLQDAGGTVTYGYDAINRQSSIQEPGAPSAIGYSYVDTTGDSDPNTPDHGQKITTTRPNSVTTTEIFDPAQRLLLTDSKIGANPSLQRFAYEYKLASGNQQQLVSKETDKAGNTLVYGYDVLDRVASAVNSAGNDFAYTYDAASNIATRTVNGGTPTTYRYNEANQLCWRLNGTSSNGCGSLPPGATRSTYDADGQQLTGFGTPAAVATYNRRQQMNLFDTAPSISMSYAGAGQAQRITMGSTAVVNNILGVGSHTTGPTADYFTRGEAGAFVSQRRPSATSPNRRIYPLRDQLGSTRTLTNESGTVIRAYGYEPYGALDSGTGTGSTPLRFAGGEFDPTGLYHLGQRYYDPATARWTQQDPIDQTGDLQEGNRYAYVGGDPINYTDPAGQRRCLNVEFLGGIEIGGIIFSGPGFKLTERVKNLIWGGASVNFLVTLGADRRYGCLKGDPKGVSKSVRRLPGYTGGP